LGDPSQRPGAIGTAWCGTQSTSPKGGLPIVEYRKFGRFRFLAAQLSAGPPRMISEGMYTTIAFDSESGSLALDRAGLCGGRNPQSRPPLQFPAARSKAGQCPPFSEAPAPGEKLRLVAEGLHGGRSESCYAALSRSSRIVSTFIAVSAFLLPLCARVLAGTA
jgi:hypothetical protein